MFVSVPGASTTESLNNQVNQMCHILATYHVCIFLRPHMLLADFDPKAHVRRWNDSIEHQV